MKFVVLADTVVFDNMKLRHDHAEWILVNNASDFLQHADADAFFDLHENACTHEHPVVNRPLFLNSVVHAISPDKMAIRINGWNGFLENPAWEVSGDITDDAKKVLSFLNKKIIECNDEPGFISARVIAMIINEAYYAEGEQVSTQKEIDTAMKLGTNYPYGPFEWVEKIGIKNIYALLKKLSMHDNRYTPSPLLQKMAEH